MSKTKQKIPLSYDLLQATAYIEKDMSLGKSILLSRTAHSAFDCILLTKLPYG